MKAVLVQAVVALVLTCGSAGIRDDRDEVAVYGNMGTLDENVRPRLVGGWPAPFLADDTGTSVVSKLGLEDDFRPGPFVADLAFWFVLLGLARLGVTRIGSRSRR